MAAADIVLTYAACALIASHSDIKCEGSIVVSAMCHVASDGVVITATSDACQAFTRTAYHMQGAVYTLEQLQGYWLQTVIDT